MQRVTSAEACVSDAVSEPAVFVLPADSAPEHTGAVLQGPGRPEEQQPYLRDPAVRRGTHCLAEYHLGDYGPAWNRCVPGQVGVYRTTPGTELLLPFLFLPPLGSSFFPAASSQDLCL